jgi:hypothetical protein
MSAGQAAVSTDDNQPFNTFVNQILSRLKAPVSFSKSLATGRANDRTSPVQNSADLAPGHGPDTIATIHHSLVSLVYGKHLKLSV